jgi:hypothetical protein
VSRKEIPCRSGLEALERLVGLGPQVADQDRPPHEI